MKDKKTKIVNHALYAATMLPTAVLTVGLTVPAPAAHAIVTPDEIIVTARRTEEVIQEIPISMTVFNQEMLDERNVVSATDLAKFTPSLSANTRFGSDQTTFAIRGFTQELRTTASVAVYFADVVAPRGGGSITSGDGAGPGSFFDLQNVQVLKGPQGTLFGRNTTGGAIQLIPQEPTSKTEGYLEVSAGDYDMRRAQGVINVPISDMARARFGIDTMKRDGYLKNRSGVGPDRFADIDYISGRASLILDLSDSVENYTIVSYTDSENNGSIQGMFACATGAPLAMICQPTLDHQGDDFYSIENEASDPVSELKQWQVINTTTWDVNDDFTVKNILSYADLEQTMRTSVFGTNFHLPDALAALGRPELVGLPLSFYPSGQWPGIPSNSQTTFVEELQFSGSALDGDLSWQAGLYYENSRPDGISGSLSPSFLTCLETPGSDPNSWACIDGIGPISGGLFAGSIASSLGKVEYINQAIYSQANYDINQELRLTVGVRYTVDETKATSQQGLYTGFPSTLPAGGPASFGCLIGGATEPDCKHDLRQKSEAPTWLLGLDYFPVSDVMLYAKYARGYRMGSVSMFAPEGIQTFEPEEVDAYEMGAKTTFRGPIPGTFNISVFYNELDDQQLQGNYVPEAGEFGSPTTAILNAGKSKIQGVEVETTLRLLDDLALNVAYTYLDTRLDEADEPPQSTSPITTFQTPVLAAGVGKDLTFSPHHNVTAGLSYRLPLAANVGDVSLGGSYTYISEQVSSDAEPYGTLDSYELVNLNMSWRAIMGSAFDAALFMTNALDEEYTTYTPGLYALSGAEFRVVGEPRMWGARLKYNFGQ